MGATGVMEPTVCFGVCGSYTAGSVLVSQFRSHDLSCSL